MGNLEREREAREGSGRLEKEEGRSHSLTGRNAGVPILPLYADL